jgi:glycosyltransferase involved in cell wall biosynthesis
MRILWLASWYPSKTQPFDGDFVQRHARAAALYDSIYVLHIVKVDPDSAGLPREEFARTGALTEHIVYNREPESSFAKLFAVLNFFRHGRRCIRQYIEQNGVPDLVHVHVTMKAGMLAWWLKRTCKLPYVVTEHYTIYNNQEPDRFDTRPWLFRKFTRAVISQSALLLPVSKQLGEVINKHVAKKSFKIIPNVVDVQHFHFAPAPPGRFRFIHVSNMVPRKNVDLIIDAMQMLRSGGVDADLVVVGEIDLKIRQKALDSGIAHAIHFTGEVNYEEVATHLKASHALVLFSTIENLPCVILEALCCGRPVISSDVGGIAEVITPLNGRLVTAGNVGKLHETLKEVMETYGTFDLREISADAVRRFNYEAVGSQIHEVYQSLRP